MRKIIIKTLTEKKFRIDEDGFEIEIYDEILNDEIKYLKKISKEIISKGIDFQIQNNIN